MIHFPNNPNSYQYYYMIRCNGNLHDIAMISPSIQAWVLVDVIKPGPGVDCCVLVEGRPCFLW